MDRIDDHFKQALVKLVAPFWGKPRIASLLWALIRQTQILEDTIKEVGDAYTIDGADDARLAILGKVVGQSRLGAWSTETYRSVIRGRIRAARSHGRSDDIVEVLRLATGITDPIQVEHPGGATVVITLPENVDADTMVAVAFLLPKARAAGIAQHLVNPPPADPLTWASSVSGGGGDLSSSVSGGGDNSFSARLL